MSLQSIPARSMICPKSFLWNQYQLRTSQKKRTKLKWLQRGHSYNKAKHLVLSQDCIRCFQINPLLVSHRGEAQTSCFHASSNGTANPSGSFSSARLQLGVRSWRLGLGCTFLELMHVRLVRGQYVHFWLRGIRGWMGWVRGFVLGRRRC